MKIKSSIVLLAAPCVLCLASAATAQDLADYQKYLETLLARVNDQMKQGKSLDQIRAERKMPEYENLEGAKQRLPNHIEAAYRTLKSGYVPG